MSTDEIRKAVEEAAAMNEAAKQIESLSRSVPAVLVADGVAKREHPCVDRLRMMARNAERAYVVSEFSDLSMARDDYRVMSNALKTAADALSEAIERLKFISTMTITIGGVDQVEPVSRVEAKAGLARIVKLLDDTPII